jgi:DNA-binding CsgD family transcriptional regulator
MDMCIESYYKRLRGLRCRRIFAEAYGSLFVQWCKTAGFFVTNDYHDFFNRHPELAPPDEFRPALMGVTAEDAFRDFGSRVAPAFRFVPPRIGFAASEQAMLRLALAGDTDEELAQALDISVWTIKKRWRQVYDRVSASAPELLENGHRDLSEEDKGRGAEQRRHFLAYLRDHFEELCSVPQWPSRGPQGETLRRERVKEAGSKLKNIPSVA